MRHIIIALLLAVAGKALAAPIPPSGCPGCILNTASPQNAQVNIGTATVRGTLTVSTLSVTNLSIVTLTATNIVGSGAGITALNASALASGTVPSARMTGSYTGITGVGTIAAGVWNGTAIGTQYGGTGQNWSAVNIGALPYFSGTGAMSTLAAGAANRVLQANGAGAPSWTAAPTVLGTNVTEIPLANLSVGVLPAGIDVPDSALSVVSGSKVTGNIGGNAANITGTLAIGQIGAGTLAADIIAQTLDDIGTPAGTFGGPTHSAQVTVNEQGRVTNVVQFSIPGISTRAAFVDVDNDWHGPGQTSRSSWTFVSNVGIGGTLSLTNALAVTSGGTGAQTLTANGVLVGNGTGALLSLPAMGAGGIITGSGTSVRPSTGTLTGTANQVIVTQTGSNIVLSGPQNLGTGSSPTFVTVTANLTGTASNATLATTATNLASGAANSIPYQTGSGATTMLAAGTGVLQEAAAGAPAWTLVPTLTGTNFSGTAASLTAGAATNLASGLIGQTPYQTAAGATSFLPAMGAGGIVTGNGTSAIPSTGTFTGTANQVIITRTGSNVVLSAPQDLGTGSSPSFVTVTAALNGNATTATSATSATTATNLAAGGAGQMPYQTGSGATSFLPSMAALGIVLGNSSGVAPSTITLAGTSNQVVLTRTASNLTFSLPQSINSGASPTFDGTNFTGIPAAGIGSGQLAIARGGTNLSSAGGTSNRVLRTSDGSTFAMGQVIGPDIAASTIPLSSLNQSGCNTNEFAKWNGSNWACGSAGAGDVILASSQTLSGANKFTSTTTFVGGVIFQTWPSTRTIIPQDSGAIGTTPASVAGSTVALTTLVASRHNLSGSLIMRISDSSANGRCWIIRDGAYFDGQSGSLPMWGGISNAGAGSVYVWTINWNTSATLAAGTYNYSIMCVTSSGNFQACQTTNATLAGTCYFEARQLP